MEAQEFRTSSQYFLPTYNDAVLEAVDARVQALTRVPISHAEFIQVCSCERCHDCSERTIDTVQYLNDGAHFRTTRPHAFL